MDSTNNGNIIKIHCNKSELKAMFYDCDISNFEIIPDSYFNTQKNAIVVLDRKQIEELEHFYYKDNEKYINIEKMWIENNNLIIFWHCYFEPLGYKQNEHITLRKWPFKYLTLSDYENYKHIDGFLFNHFMNLVHMIGLDTELINYLEMDIEHSIDKQYDYSFSFFSPRIHKIELLNKMIDGGTIENTLVNMNKPFYDNHKNKLSEDNTIKYVKENIKQIFKSKKIYRNFDDYQNYVNYNNGELKYYETYTTKYLKDKEYDMSYIDLNAETHCIFDIPPANTEKVYKSILTEKPFICIGAQKIYEELEKIGVNNYSKIFGLEILQNSNEPFEQIDYVIDFQKKNKNNIKSLFEDSTEIRKNNRKLFLDNYKKMTHQIYDFIISYYATSIKS